MSELVEQVAKALEPLVDQRPAIDASASHIRSLQARALARAALSVLEPRIEALERELGWQPIETAPLERDDEEQFCLRQLLAEAADELARLRAENEALREAWRAIEAAPVNTPVCVKVGAGISFIARLVPNGSMSWSWR